MKVLLLSLPGVEENDGSLFPLGIGFLAAALKNNHEVKALHYVHMSEAKNDLPQVLKSFMPDCIGLTCTSFNRKNVKQIIFLSKKICPEVKIIVGGVHASFCAEQVLRTYKADIVVIGEGEISLPEVCDTLDNKASLHGVAGIAFLEDGSFVQTAERMMISKLEELPSPDFSFAESLIAKSGMGFLITSRGCPGRCSFCSTGSYWGQKVRMWSPSRVVDEMELLIKRFGVKKIFFHDDTFNLGLSRVKDICRIIRDRGIKVEWGCSCRVTPISEEIVQDMVSAGCRHICWGVESGSESMLKSIAKNITLEQIRTAFNISAKFSDVLSSGCFVMVGNPGETRETIKETIDFLNTLPMTDAPSTSILYILPGTPIYEDLRKRGKVKHEDWACFDSIPYYTLENSYLNMMQWRKQIIAAGKRLPFDRKKHFWFGELMPEDSLIIRNKNLRANKNFCYRLATKLYRVLKNPQIFMKYLSIKPTEKITFS